MYLQHIQFQYLCRLLAAQQAAQMGQCPALIAVHKFLDVRARLLIYQVCLGLQGWCVPTSDSEGNLDAIWSGAALLGEKV